jgi:hypothetical protein
MADLHIDDFYRDSALILLTLYNNFPRKLILYVDDVFGPDSPDDFGLHSDRYQSCFSTMVWLAEHGYIRFDTTVRQEALDQAVLTERGFLMLSSRSEMFFGDDDEVDESLPPSVMEASRTNVAQLRIALRENSSIMIKQCVHTLLSFK